MNRIEETWRVFVQIATFGLYSNEFRFLKRNKKKVSVVYHSTTDAADICSRGTNRKKEISTRCPE